MLDERKHAILRAVVREYIATAQPVGSGHVAAAPGVAVSSATVRNEMAVLEQEGYLAQPHTSAGRVPTDKGYRFYVDHLADRTRLDVTSTQQVKEFFDSAHGALEEMLAQTSQMLSDLTTYASVVVAPPQDNAIVRSIQLVALSPQLVLAVAVLSNGNVEKAMVEVISEPSTAVVASASAALSRVAVGTPLADLARREPVRTGDPDIDRLVVRARAALADRREHELEAVYVGGVARMAASFDAVEVVRDVLTTLERQFVVVSLLRDLVHRGLSVAIGAEHGVEPLAACSVIVAPVEVGGVSAGTVAVLGPTRMDYPQSLAAVHLVSEQLGRHLAEG
jgi:heat-inducible transcriptional repressor